MICLEPWSKVRPSLPVPCCFPIDLKWSQRRRRVNPCGFILLDTSTRCLRRACAPELCPAPSPTPPPPAPAGPSHLVSAFMAEMDPLSSSDPRATALIWSCDISRSLKLYNRPYRHNMSWKISNVEQTLAGSHVSKVGETLGDMPASLTYNLTLLDPLYVISTQYTFPL